MKPVPFTEALAYAKAQKVVLPGEYYGERIGLARAQARTISGLAGVDQIQHVFDLLDKEMKSGGTFQSFRKAVEAGDVGVALSRNHLELIYRNNIQTAYSAGRWQQVVANKDNRPYLMYIAVNDGRTRPRHRAMHGHIAKIDDPWWATHHPLNGYRCRCTTRSLGEAEAKRKGIKPAPKAAPDKGWEYNPGMAPMDGLKQAAQHKKAVVHPKLRGAVDKAVAGVNKPVSAAIETVSYKRKVRHVLGVIDSVHSDGTLPIIPIKRTDRKSSYFRRRLFDNLPLEIGMSTKQSLMHEHALTHEIGHFLDHGALNSKAFDYISDAAYQSKSIKEISTRLKSTRNKRNEDYYNYLLRPVEIWARAYAQWLTEKSGDAILVKQLNEIMKDERRVMQWSNEDFRGISAAIDKSMIDRGWLNHE